MSGSSLTAGSPVVIGGRLGYVTRSGRIGRASGHWVTSPTGDPGASAGYPSFAPDWCVRPAVVGVTVCPKPRGACWCGLVHVRPDQLDQLEIKAGSSP